MIELFLIVALFYLSSSSWLPSVAPMRGAKIFIVFFSNEKSFLPVEFERTDFARARLVVVPKFWCCSLPRAYVAAPVKDTYLTSRLGSFQNSYLFQTINVENGRFL